MAITFQTDSAGNLNVALVPPTGASSTYVQGAGAVASAIVGNPVAIGVNADGANAASSALKTVTGDTAGAAHVNTEGQKATYTAAFQVTPASSATDIVQLIGSSTSIVRVTRVSISGIATAAAVIDVVGIKRSAADSSGTISAQTIVNHDSGDAVASAVCSAITANPTLGATGSKYGNCRFGKVALQTAAGTVAPVPLTWDFTNRNEKGLVLRGVAQAFCVNLNGVQSSGQVMNVEVTWTEE